MLKYFQKFLTDNDFFLKNETQNGLDYIYSNPFENKYNRFMGIFRIVHGGMYMILHLLKTLNRPKTNFEKN